MLQASIHISDTEKYIKFVDDIDEEFDLKDDTTYFGCSDGTVFKVDLKDEVSISKVKTGRGTGIKLGLTEEGNSVIQIKAKISWILADAVFLESEAKLHGPVREVLQATPKPEAVRKEVKSKSEMRRHEVQKPPVKQPRETTGRERYLSHEQAQELIKTQKIPYNVIVEEPIRELGEVELVKVGGDDE